jgi:uncharacterized membrane protein YwaF
MRCNLINIINNPGGKPGFSLNGRMGVSMSKILEVVPFFYYYVSMIVIFLLIFFGFKRRSDSTKLKVLYLLCIIDFPLYIINDYYFLKRGDNILTMLPLQLCNIAVFMIPLALILKKRVLYDFIFYVCALGAFIALIIPSSDYLGQTYSFMTISFFIFHSIIVITPFLLAGWGLYIPTPTIKNVVRLSVAIFIIALFMHLLNLAIGKWFGVETDYFFTIIKYSAPRNPAFELFSKIIPVDLIYLLPGLLILWIYIPLISLPWNVKKWFNKANITLPRNETQKRKKRL